MLWLSYSQGMELHFFKVVEVHPWVLATEFKAGPISSVGQFTAQLDYVKNGYVQDIDIDVYSYTSFSDHAPWTCMPL